MKRERIIRRAERELNSRGYATVLASNMHTCADVFAERKGAKFVIKIVSNIDSVTRKEADSLHRLAQFLDAEPIIVGLTSKDKRLEGDVTHYRFSVRCMPPQLLSEMEFGQPGILASKSVGLKLKIDGTKLRNLRKVGNLRISDLAHEASISKATLYKHEMSQSYASVSTVAKLERILNGSIRSEELPENKKIRLHEAKLARTGIAALQVENAPFDIVAKSRNYYEISLDANIRTLMKRAMLFDSIRKTFENNYPFFITNKRTTRIGGIPAIKKKDLSGIESEDELLNRIF